MPTESLGERIRRLRRASGKTLQQVAGEAGLTAGFLSQVERGISGITLSSLAGIARAIGAPMPDLFATPGQPVPDSHAGRRRTFSPVDHGQSYERLSSAFPGSQLNAVKLTLPVGYRSERVAHGGDEFVYVLAGQVQYTLGDRPFPLGPGDALHFDGRQAHRLENLGRQPARLISVGTLALFPDPDGPAPEAPAAAPAPGPRRRR
jgi:transcriptional regulator with XRE-family HTH domain